MQLLSKEEISVLPASDTDSRSGIYFLFDDEEIVYIGMSTNIGLRIFTHQYDHNKKFTRHTFLAVEESVLRDYEREYIRSFSPPLNKVHHPEWKPSYVMGPSKSLAFSVPIDEAEEYRLAAEKAGYTVANYLRRIVRKAHGRI